MNENLIVDLITCLLVSWIISRLFFTNKVIAEMKFLKLMLVSMKEGDLKSLGRQAVTTMQLDIGYSIVAIVAIIATNLLFREVFLVLVVGGVYLNTTLTLGSKLNKLTTQIKNGGRIENNYRDK